MSSAPKYQPHYTVDDYRLWDGDWELWSGVAVAMTPSPFGRHGHLLSRIATALNNAIDSADCKASVLLEVDWIVDNETVVRPDLTLVCGTPPERHVEETPALVVEVLSDGTRDRDLTVKRDLFQHQSVEWYLIIDPNDDSLQVLRLNQNGQYAAVELGDQVTIDVCETCSLSVELSRLFR